MVEIKYIQHQALIDAAKALAEFCTRLNGEVSYETWCNMYLPLKNIRLALKSIECK